MTITLTHDTTTITLQEDLYWADENNWNPVEQTAQRTITGALIVQSAVRVKGRPITLQPNDESSAWMPRATLDALRNLAAVPGIEMTLTLRGITYNVTFRHYDGIAVEATPIVHYNDVVSADWYRVTIRLMEI